MNAINPFVIPIREPVTCDTTKFLSSWDAVNCCNEAVATCNDCVDWCTLANVSLTDDVYVLIPTIWESTEAV